MNNRKTWKYESYFHRVVPTNFDISILTFYRTYILTFCLAQYTSILTFYLKSLLTLYVTSCARNWGLACSAHWDLALAVEVRQCPLSSGARRWGPAVPTELWSSLRSGSHWDLELAVEAEAGVEVGRPALIKSRDPRLAEPPIYCRTYNPPSKYRPCQVGAWRITFLQNWLIFKVKLLGDGMVPYF